MSSMCRITSSRHCCRRRSSTAIESASRTEPTRLRARVPIVRKRPNRGTRRFARAAAAVMLLDSHGGSGREERMNYQHIRVVPASAYVGAEIGGVELAKPVGDEAMAEIRLAFGEYGVVFFRDQYLSPEQHVAFAERFAPIDINRFFAAVPGYPMIAEVRKEPEQQRNIGGGWHTDHSYDEVPALGSMLYAREVPKTGGDTLFASMYAAYDALSDGLKATLKGLKALHSSRHVFGVESYEGRGDLKGRYLNPEAAMQDAVHPVVVRHPGAGRK